MQINERLKFYRTFRRKTLRDLGNETGLSVSHISSIERGVTMPSLETCQRMANVYSISLTLLFAGVEVDVRRRLTVED